MKLIGNKKAPFGASSANSYSKIENQYVALYKALCHGETSDIRCTLRVNADRLWLLSESDWLVFELIGDSTFIIDDGKLIFFVDTI